LVSIQVEDNNYWLRPNKPGAWVNPCESRPLAILSFSITILNSFLSLKLLKVQLFSSFYRFWRIYSKTFPFLIV
jgi:hypothetical protein